MRAIVQDRYGTVDVWRLAETATPDIAAIEVLVQVRAAGMDRGTWHLMTGRTYPIRLLGFGLLRPKNRGPRARRGRRGRRGGR
jgi:NADPH:quinone reductase-like Zn-dependent oxidoreductase